MDDPGEVEREMRRRIEEALAVGFSFFGSSDRYVFDLADHILADLKAAWREAHPQQPRYQKVKIPRTLARLVFERDGYRCAHCGDWHDLAADHIIPESKGGPTTLDNLQTLCKSCNSSKGASR